MPDLEALSVDQHAALEHAASSLRSEFAGTFSEETVVLFLESSYHDFAARARFDHFLPLIAERFARQRLRALARVEGKDEGGPPIVLFLCVHNAGRSQMAMGWFSHIAGTEAVAWSGGSDPTTDVNPAVIDAMAEIGIDISSEFPKPWTDEIVRAADVVVTMGCGDACPIFPGKRYLEWEVADPADLDVAAVRPIRDEIGQRVRHLLAEFGVGVGVAS